MRSRRDRLRKKLEKVGGFAFYLSLLSLSLLSVSNICALATAVPVIVALHRIDLAILAGAGTLGYFFSLIVLNEHIHVFMHETKHALVSGLVGNTWKGMNVGSHSGHFEYSYSKHTAHYNAIICLAPYFVPLITIPALLLAAAAFRTEHRIMVAIISFAAGIDLYSNIKDIDPRQSDFVSIKGGYRVALVYVISANAFLLSVLIAWGLMGYDGLRVLVFFFVDLISRITGKPLR